MSVRVCFVSLHSYGYFDPDHGYTGGGAERQIYLLSTALADRFDVHVVVGDYGQPRTERRENVTLHRAYPLQSRQSLLQPVRHLLLLARAMRRADADLYVYRGGPRNAPFVYSITRLLGRRWLYHVASDSHVEAPYARSGEPIPRAFRQAIRRADSVVAQSDYQRQKLRANFGVDATAIPNGYPVASDLVPYAQRQYVLWVGRMDEEQKRPHLFLDLAERLPDQTFRLVGPLDDTDTYQRNVRQRAVEQSNVQFYGTVTPDEIHEQYRHAVTLVNTSAFEGFPNTFLEAWRQGTPTVSLDVDPGRFCISYDCFAAGDLDALAQMTAELCTDLSHRETVGRESRRQFESRYALSRVAERYAGVIRDAVQT